MLYHLMEKWKPAKQAKPQDTINYLQIWFLLFVFAIWLFVS